MLDKLEGAERRYSEIETLLADPACAQDREQYRALSREYKQLTPLIAVYHDYRAATAAEREAEALLHDPELASLAQEEQSAAHRRAEEALATLRELLLQRDPDDDRAVVIEIRAGAGGDEAALFCADLYRMYCMYATRRGYRVELMSANETELGGFREIVFLLDGEGAYARLKFESGVHRVQRVPQTESQGRIQTSTATVAVLPQVEEVDVQLNPGELKIESCKSSGAGGQHINKTESAIRVTHLPTGIVVECQDERSQFKNKDKALRLLRAKLYEKEQREQDEKIAGERRRQVGTGDRSERIRTYNFPEGRVSDHRIKLTLYALESFLNGDMDKMIDALLTADRAARLSDTE